MKIFYLCCVVFCLSVKSLAVVEFKTQIYTSISYTDKSDIIFASHNSLLVGSSGFKWGGYYGLESYHSYVVDHSFGAAFKFGEVNFLELQFGYFSRDFKNHQDLHETSTGFIVNTFFGHQFSNHLNFAFLLSGKKIISGMDKRILIDFYPFLGVKFEI